MKKAPYKEESPLKTIQNIRNILINNDIFTLEFMWWKFHDSFYSSRVVIKDTHTGTNGKGRTPEYCLASAYGEFMERLQNMLLFPRTEFDPTTLSKYGFLVDYHEKTVSPSSAGPLPASFSMATPFTTDETLYDYWIDFLQDKSEKNKIFLVPFYNPLKKEKTFLPYFFLSHVYRSNGMCAGNTHEESIVQGLLEILERYVMKQIYLNDIVPPSVPEDFLKTHAPEQYDRMKEIEEKDNFTIHVKDCSLDREFPVVAILIMDNETTSYVVKYGAELDFSWALERCLTEFFQGGYKNKLVNKFSELSLDPYQHYTDVDNFSSIVATGKGRHANSFFDPDYSYPFKGIQHKSFHAMKEKLTYLLQLIKRQGFPDIFIRDCSFLGFPSHNIIIPGLSEGFILSEYHRYRMSHQFSPVKAISGLRTATNDELKELIYDLENFSAVAQRKDLLLSDYFPIPQHDNLEWKKITLDFLLSMIYIRIGDFHKARENLSRFIQFIKKYYRNIDLRYHLCVREYLSLKIRNYDNENIKRILLTLFDTSIAELVTEDLSDSKNVFAHLPLPTCWDCNKCPIVETCGYEILKKIYLTIKKNQKADPLDCLQNIFENH